MNNADYLLNLNPQPTYPVIQYFGNMSRVKQGYIKKIQNEKDNEKAKKEAKKLFRICMKHNPNNKKGCKSLTEVYVEFFFGKTNYKKILEVPVHEKRIVYVPNEKFFDAAKSEKK